MAKYKEYKMLTIEDLRGYKSVSQLAKDLGYRDASYLARKVNKLQLGIKAKELGLSFLDQRTIILSPSDIATLIKNLRKFKEETL